MKSYRDVALLESVRELIADAVNRLTLNVGLLSEMKLSVGSTVNLNILPPYKEQTLKEYALYVRELRQVNLFSIGKKTDTFDARKLSMLRVEKEGVRTDEAEVDW
jgi:hypothetical protein